MDRLDDLRRKRDELEREIATLEQIAVLEEERKVLERDYVRIVCTVCRGAGAVTRGGADILSDPPYAVPCDSCANGWVWARKWDGVRTHHDMDLDNRDGW